MIGWEMFPMKKMPMNGWVVVLIRLELLRLDFPKPEHRLLTFCILSSRFFRAQEYISKRSRIPNGRHAHQTFAGLGRVQTFHWGARRHCQSGRCRLYEVQGESARCDNCHR